LYICLKEQDNNDTANYVPVPLSLQTRVHQAYAALGLEESHPVVKVPLHVYRINEMLHIDAVQPTTQSVGAGGDDAATHLLQDTAPTGPNTRLNNEALQSVVIRLNRLEQIQGQSQQCIMNSISEMQTQQKRQFQILNNNIRCFGGRIEGSFVRQVNSNRRERVLTMNQVDEVNAEPLEAVNNANLSHLPRDLAALWREYQHGLYGMKPARLFTTEERNNTKLKQKYYRRNQIWQIMVKQSRRGLTPEQAANEIYMVYGARTSVTKIIDCIIKDKERYKETGGFHPNLSV
jgi:hypothetical protein